MRYLEGETMSYPRNEENFNRKNNSNKVVTSIMKKK